MREALFPVCLLVMVGCTTAELERASKPTFKGMELYSWKPAGGEWNFTLLAGTNRQKPISEIIASRTAIVRVFTLKRKLSQLANGEQVFWGNVAKEPVPGEMIKELIAFCGELYIKLEKL